MIHGTEAAAADLRLACGTPLDGRGSQSFPLEEGSLQSWRDLAEGYPRDSGCPVGQCRLVHSVPNEDMTMTELGLIAAKIIMAVVAVEATDPTLGLQAEVHVAD